MDNKQPFISIITIVYNGVDFLEETIQSVLNQNYENIEYIVIDGGSTDGTIEIIRKHEDKINFWVSESDNGISDAFNKGIDQATGDFILILNCGDTLIASNAIDANLLSENINKIVTFQAKTPHGNIFPSTYTYSTYEKDSFAALRNLVQNAMVAHQATFVPKYVYDEIGGYNQEYTIRMDFEFFLRASQKFEIKFYSNPIILYPTDGISSKLKNRLRFKMEELKAIHDNLCTSCLFYDMYFFAILPFYFFKKFLSSIKYILLDWKS